MVEIEGYLTQEKLEKALKQIIQHDDWLGREVYINRYQRWDMSFKVNNQVFVVEFDGDSHYRNPQTIRSEREKNAIAESLGQKVIRIPYWVQLTTETLKHFFQIDHQIKQDFPHGFIDKKAMLPASFCELGMKRFDNEICMLPQRVMKQVLDSLKGQMAMHHRDFVIYERLSKLGL